MAERFNAGVFESVAIPTLVATRGSPQVQILFPLIKK